jgi:GNAT superfamily N-acetyltransferase
MALRIREASIGDVGVILHFLQRMADFDGRPTALKSTPETIRQSVFGDPPQVFVLVAEVDGTPAGFASYFRTYSTLLGQPGIWLDDLYVEENARGGGIGTALLRHLAHVAETAGCGRLEWTVGVNNSRGIDFYRRHGAILREHVRLCRLDLDAIARFASGG